MSFNFLKYKDGIVYKYYRGSVKFLFRSTDALRDSGKNISKILRRRLQQNRGEHAGGGEPEAGAEAAQLRDQRYEQLSKLSGLPRVPMIGDYSKGFAHPLPPDKIAQRSIL